PRKQAEPSWALLGQLLRLKPNKKKASDTTAAALPASPILQQFAPRASWVFRRSGRGVSAARRQVAKQVLPKTPAKRKMNGSWCRRGSHVQGRCDKGPRPSYIGAPSYPGQKRCTLYRVRANQFRPSYKGAPL
ncbi:unnamed protein product, partial [Ectocarpus sp. 13 AM-2016]